MLADVWLFNTTFDGFFEKTAYEVLVSWAMSSQTGDYLAKVMIYCTIATFVLIFIGRVALVVTGYNKFRDADYVSGGVSLLLLLFSRYAIAPIWLILGFFTHAYYILKDMLGYGSIFM